MGWSNAIFETDCQVIINCLNEPNSACPGKIRIMVEDIKVWMSTRSWSFSWCYRKKNKAAHWLACSSLNRSFLCHPSCFLPGLDALIVRDLSVEFLFLYCLINSKKKPHDSATI
ncbi:hypothetical protein RHMOL_Rhmol10G0077400 [Rhododendron molle]|uniref:Uncharacterized protein n=1 Tax=Rhododendron molle TaxID=49168 RepID=A0ACC0LZP8_RHOML|nr:hypothetical protein RHMOL_Rhmol10G0077400 [Rhododendron molle]